MALSLFMKSLLSCIILLLCFRIIACEDSSHSIVDPLQDIKEMIRDKFDIMNSRFDDMSSKQQILHDRFNDMSSKQQILIDRLHILDSKISKMDDTLTEDVQERLVTLEAKVLSTGERTSQLINNAKEVSVNEIKTEGITFLEEITKMVNQGRNLIDTAVNNITLKSKEIITQLDDFKAQCLDEINTLDPMDEKLNQTVTTINTLVKDPQVVNFNGAGTPYADNTNRYRPPHNAFKGQRSTYWHSDDLPPVSLWFRFNHGRKIVKFSFRSRDDGYRTVDSGAVEYEFFGSDSDACDESSRVTLYTTAGNGTLFTMDNAPKTITINNNIAYTCYGFNVNTVGNPQRGATISDIHFWEI